jgi:hypothetical protein
MVPELTIAHALNELANETEAFVDTKRAFLTGFLVANGVSINAIPNAETGGFQLVETTERFDKKRGRLDKRTGRRIVLEDFSEDTKSLNKD